MNIKEAAKATGLSNDTIRYYERIGVIMPVPRK
ncbi:MerR family DNA-binding transcriptional regulator [Fructobacillus cardui]|nr:MerR family DNA-binding transcriptional regulator [Fructobacillus cardui]MCK8627958.1 MerR family DNA-binding transcriptional regulator [Fructobacillus cardui]